jgi:phage shock protein PspC (stress-responsive transcriptional regulator)
MVAQVKKLYRSSKDRILGGVCGGIGEFFGIDPTIVRLAWILFSFMGGAGILFYLIAWLIIPRNPKQKW